MIDIDYTSTMDLLDKLPFFNINNTELSNTIKPDNHIFNFQDQIYSTIDELNSKLNTINIGNNCYLSIFHMNIRSLVKHFDNLHQIINSLPDLPDIIAITETKLNKNSHLNFIQISNYTFINRDSPSCAGGVGLYIKDKFNYVVRDELELSNCEAESLWINLDMGNNKKITIGVIYKHPKYQISKFSENINKVLSITAQENQNCYLIGDFNINTLSQSKATTNYLKLIKSFNYHNVIKFPTRITKNSATCIDHLYTNNKNTITKKFILIDNTSDHLPIYAVIKVKFISKKYEPIYYRNFSKLNNPKLIEEFATEFQNLYYSFHQNPNNDIHTEFEILTDTINNIVTKNLPLQKLSKKKTKLKQKPWISSGILKSSKLKNNLFKKWVKSNYSDKNLEIKYKTYLNKYTHIKHAAKQKYFQKQLNTHKKDPKKTWDTIHNLIGKTKKKTKLPEKLSVNNKILNKPKEIANALNKHFAEIGKSDRNEIDFNYLNKNFKHRQKDSIVFHEITEKEISLTITNLKNKSSQGPDELPFCIIKKLKDVLSPLLCYLFNKSIKLGEYPKCLKIGKVLPLFKKGKLDEPGNYRPIIILPAINKVFEKIIFNRLTSFFNSKKIIKNNQFGFRPGYSTELALCKFNEDILTDIDNGYATCAVLIDLSKAFDSVNRTILLFKLFNYGIRGNTYNLLKSYLSNRNQFIHVENTKSNTCSVNVGVPQGSIISPLLFLILINDLPNCTNMQVLNFADDTLLYKKFPKQHKNIENDLNLELKKVSDWMEANHLKINASKTNFLIFSPKSDKFNKLNNLKLTINNTNIKQTKSCKYLGMELDNKLTWKNHIDKLTLKISKALGILFRIRHYLNKPSLNILLNSLVINHIKYGILCYGRASKTSLNPLNVLLNRALRCINFLGKFDKKNLTYIF